MSHLLSPYSLRSPFVSPYLHSEHKPVLTDKTYQRHVWKMLIWEEYGMIRKAAYWLALWSMLNLLSYTQPRTTRPGMASLTVGWTLFHINRQPRKCPCRLTYRQIWWRHFAKGGSPSQITQTCITFQKTSQSTYSEGHKLNTEASTFFST